jgi:hypothetical protein
MDGDENKTRPDGNSPAEEPRTWKNIGKAIFLIAALAAAWFLLDWLIGGR